MGRRKIPRKIYGFKLGIAGKQQDQSRPALIPVQVHGLSEASDKAIVLKHSNGHQLDLPSTISAAWLAELLTCLG